MIITAMYLYGIIHGSWHFSWWYGFLAFVMDAILLHGLNLSIGSDDNEEPKDKKD